jgi:type 1 glutamine amidotransferase
MGDGKAGIRGGRRLALCMAAVLGGAIGGFADAPAKSKLKKILVLDKSEGGANGHLESRRDLNQALKELAADKGFAITTIGQSDDASRISSEFSTASLSAYQAVLFSNNDGADKQLDAASKANFEAYVKNGGGFIPIHAASAYITNWPWLSSALVQSFFGPHGYNMPTANVAHDAQGTKDGTETKGIFKGLTAPLAFLDEYYSFQSTPRGAAGVTVLLTVDEKSYSQPVFGPMGSDHPVVWSKTEGKGRVVHLSMGHSWSSNNVYAAKNGYLKQFLYGSLRYAAGDFTGCTNPAYLDYNPDATKSDPAACLTPAGVRIPGGEGGSRAPIIARAGGGIDVDVHAEGVHEISVRDVSGKVVDRRSGSGPRQYHLAVPGKSGFYLVKAKAGGEEAMARVTVL